MSWRLLRQSAQLQLRTPFLSWKRSPVFSIAEAFTIRQPVLRHGFLKGSRRWNSNAAESSASSAPSHGSSNVAASLRACPGCGALAQIVELGQAGYYSTKRRTVRSYIKSQSVGEKNDTKNADDELVRKASESVDPELVKSLNLEDASETGAGEYASAELPLCDRCHELVHHNTGVSIVHPSIESLHDTIAESPYKYNHIYHILDAADFPLSLVPKIHSAVGAAFQRSMNRRSHQGGYKHGKKTEISFVITRSDLLAPKKEQVDGMMQYFISVLRDALGSFAQDVRLGNVRCVSAKRGWWTRELKADIWRRGAGGWMVGKVNVGKSNLFEVVFPKGQSENINFDALRRKSRKPANLSVEQEEYDDISSDNPGEKDIHEDENLLLPPARLETSYPKMPIISSLPGTTASPIRIPFGNGRGELIDLPGLARSQLETFVRPEFRDDLVMKARITPKQHVLRSGQSLLLGGLIRITPVDENIVILAYPFVPIEPHLTSTDKAIRMETEGPLEFSGVPYVVDDSVGRLMASAGKFKLEWDVTKQRAGPLTSRSAVGLKPSQLPFVVLSADILIEGVGWVELVAQVRKARGTDEPAQIPEVEVFSPKGMFVGVRQPMNAWMLGGRGTKPSAATNAKKRPRRSMAAAQRTSNA